jgi:hypothetical protein
VDACLHHPLLPWRVSSNDCHTGAYILLAGELIQFRGVGGGRWNLEIFLEVYFSSMHYINVVSIFSKGNVYRDIHLLNFILLPELNN